MSAVRLVTHCTRGWLPRLAPYLASLSENSPWPATLLTVDHAAPAEFTARFPQVAAVAVPRAAGSPDPTQSLQHGAFEPHVPGEADDVLIYTDGDIVLQRAPEAHERERLAGLSEDDVVAGYNSGPNETLADEAARLFPRGNLNGAWGDLARPCYNVGVIAMRRATWRAVHALYLAHWARVSETFGHAARQQWLICWALAELGLKVIVPGYGFHANGHYGVPPGVLYENGLVTYQGAPVLFRHRL